MIDTHCHLDYLEDPASALTELGLSRLICIGADVTHAHNAIALAETYPEVFASVGLHPTEVAEQDCPQIRAELERLSLHPRVVGIGETGLDEYWAQDQLEVQRGAFEWQLDLGRRRDLPVIVHTRDAPGGERASLGCAETDPGVRLAQGYPALLQRPRRTAAGRRWRAAGMSRLPET